MRYCPNCQKVYIEAAFGYDAGGRIVLYGGKATTLPEGNAARLFEYLYKNRRACSYKELCKHLYGSFDSETIEKLVRDKNHLGNALEVFEGGLSINIAPLIAEGGSGYWLLRN